MRKLNTRKFRDIRNYGTCTVHMAVVVSPQYLMVKGWLVLHAILSKGVSFPIREDLCQPVYQPQVIAESNRGVDKVLNVETTSKKRGNLRQVHGVSLRRIFCVSYIVMFPINNYSRAAMNCKNI